MEFFFKFDPVLIFFFVKFSREEFFSFFFFVCFKGFRWKEIFCENMTTLTVINYQENLLRYPLKK